MLIFSLLFMSFNVVCTSDHKHGENVSNTLYNIGVVFFQENTLDILVENHGRVNYVHQGFNKFNEERKGEIPRDNIRLYHFMLFDIENFENHVDF